MKSLKALILDLDMTLVDTLPRFFKVYNWTRKKFGLPVMKEPEFLKKFEEDALSEGIPEEILENFWVEFRRRYCDFESDGDRPIPGALELLKRAKEKGIKVIITTGRECPPEKIWEELRRFRMEEYVDAVYTLAMSKEKNGFFDRREITRKALQDFGLSPDEVVFVADYLPDMECGKELGIFTIGVKTGKKSEKALYEHGASIVLNDISDVLKYLGI